MKIALIDNMNNNFFALARYLRDLGFEADLFLIPGRTFPHFDPQQDTWAKIKNVFWIKEFPIPYHPLSYLRPVCATLRQRFWKYDKIIACGPSLGLLSKANIYADLFIPYGGDLFNLPWPSTAGSFGLKKALRFPLENYRAKLQRTGIKKSKKIIVNTNWSLANKALKELNCKAVNLPRVMIYKESAPKNIDQKYAWLSDFEFTVFSPTRHLWASNTEPMADFIKNGGAKRNDKLIGAFAKVVKARLVRRPLLLFCDYGADVDQSKKLISDLKIDPFVKWLPLLPRKEILNIMSHVTVVADQFRVGMSATSAGTTNEALAVGKPVITNTDNAIFDEKDPYFKCPILQASSKEEIFKWFIKILKSPKFAKSVGNAGAKWFNKNLSLQLVKKYISLLN